MRSLVPVVLLGVALTAVRVPLADGRERARAGAAIEGPPTAAEFSRDTGMFRVALDSGMVLVRLNSTGFAVEVIAPSGTFMLFAATATALNEWIEAAMLAERSVTAGGGTMIDPAVLRTEGKIPIEFRLDPVVGDPRTRFLLSGGNGAWEFNLAVSAAQSDAIFSALRGELRDGVTTYEHPRMGGTTSPARPHVYGAWLGNQVDQPVGLRSGIPRIAYPGELRGSGVEGMAELSFIVDANGRARPSSIRLIRAGHPLLALAARRSLLTLRYRPARLDGNPVAQIVQQQFWFVE